MKAAIFIDNQQPLALRDVPIPEIASDEVLLKVKACGICGSDIHAYKANFLPSGVVMGHEFAGEIATVGSDVSNEWQIGDNVVAMPVICCGRCSFCERKDFIRCVEQELIGFSNNYTGAYAEYVSVKASCIIRVPDTIPMVTAAAYEPLAVGYAAFRDAKVTADEDILILGAGPIGIALAKWASYYKVATIGVSEPEPIRRERVAGLGATHVIDPSQCENPIEEYKRQTGTVPKVILECVGLPGMLQKMIDMSERGTRLVSVGAGMEPELISAASAALKELTLSFVAGYDYEDVQFVIDAMSSGKISADGMITGTSNLDSMPDTFQDLMQPNTHCKIVVTP